VLFSSFKKELLLLFSVRVCRSQTVVGTVSLQFGFHYPAKCIIGWYFQLFFNVGGGCSFVFGVSVWLVAAGVVPTRI
jgi:hypothetical protein